MKLSQVKIKDIIEGYNQSCGIPNLTVENVSGINRDKEFFEPSKQVGRDTSNYKEVPNGYFACNLMHIGRDRVLPIAMNHSGRTKYVSPAYFVFRVKDHSTVLPEYLFIFLNSVEKDRFFWFHTDSSVRDGMSWEDFRETSLEVPPVNIQQKFVNVYSSIQSYQRKIEDELSYLLNCFTSMMTESISKGTKKKLGPLIIKTDDRNEHLEYSADDVVGVANTRLSRLKEFVFMDVVLKIVRNNSRTHFSP